ncbi:MAG TPA: hypothetical protein QGG59_01825 [Planctomycetota bacterium]|jgi:hypothetical protein|nr:hypothetical protein [Planctomycetota bacterium]MDP6129672.1 hypothetical protein [Planctomycetota bacterium]MDP7246565.1 hypothetical protein [Planctomycetota bacterium]HJM38833.1 hypothetical protein [Planctomycetota bacterium]|tara:strand:+ start:2852 stop:3271 length:420 start_codon:yes stop_codon:yes gene_type:complete
MNSVAATSASSAATIAAAEAAQRAREEEEQMTPYTQAEIEGDWEFKILRSTGNIFLKPEKRAEVLEQEARAGWELLEVFDGRRIRLKRSTLAKKDDHALDIDPYRAHIGMSSESFGLVVFLVILVLAGFTVFAVYMAQQ